MKKITSLLLSLCTIVSVFSQTTKEDVYIIQNLFGKEKRAIVEEFIQSSPTSNDIFWGLYDAYELSRKELGLKRINLLENYTASYSTLDDAQTDAIMNQIIEQQNAVDKLILTYYKKIRKEVGAKQAAQFYQLEYHFLNVIRVSIFESIPMIGEFDILAE